MPPFKQGWPIAFLALNIVIFTVTVYATMGGASPFINWSKTYSTSLLTLYMGMVLTLMIGNLVDWNFKAVLVFWDWPHLPITRAFKRYLSKKCGADAETPNSNTDQLSSSLSEQEALWFRVYSKHKSDPAVTGVCNNFLLAQELTWLSLVVLIFFGMAFVVTAIPAVETLVYFSLLLFQYIAASTVARSYGIRFFSDVLAVAETHKII